MNKVLLISMPFSSTKWPAIGISLLKPRLLQEGIGCDIAYFNIVFAEMIGLDRYEEIALYPKYLMGERLFARDYFGDRLPNDEEYKQYLRKAYRCQDIADASFEDLLATGRFVGPFLERCIGTRAWEDYDLIGFTTMFEQNLASMGLARRIKERFPTKTIVFGGANCEREMGIELHRQFHCIDYVCSGEADRSFPDLVKRLARGESVEDVPGIVYRKDGQSIMTEGNPLVVDLDALPYPDYDDYFAQLGRSKYSPAICYEIHMESSRGCWWGAKSQCNFCGLNGKSIKFRAKSEGRVLAELSHLVEHYVTAYDLTLISMVDNVLSMDYFKGLIPALQKKQFPVSLFYEVKANLKQEQVQALHDAGIIWVQPGIESLNSRVLKLMRKGVTALQNVQLLKYCMEYGVYPTWNIIYCFPGEKEDDYRQMIDLIYKITHLAPPEGFIPLCLQRFSPYYRDPEKYGFTNIRAEESYRHIYPFDGSVLANLAYFFEFDFSDGLRPPDRVGELSEAVEYWRACHERKEYLHYREFPGTLLIEDGRSNARVPCMVLESYHREIYRYCDHIRSFTGIYRQARNTYSSDPIRPRDVRDFLNEMVSLGLMANEGDRYLSLALPYKASVVANPVEYRAA